MMERKRGNAPRYDGILGETPEEALLRRAMIRPSSLGDTTGEFGHLVRSLEKAPNVVWLTASEVRDALVERASAKASADLTDGRIGIVSPGPGDVRVLFESPSSLIPGMLPKQRKFVPGGVANERGDLWTLGGEKLSAGEMYINGDQVAEACKFGWKVSGQATLVKVIR